MGSIPNIVKHVISYHCAKFGAFTTKPTILMKFGTNLPDKLQHVDDCQCCWLLRQIYHLLNLDAQTKRLLIKLKFNSHQASSVSVYDIHCLDSFPDTIWVSTACVFFRFELRFKS